MAFIVLAFVCIVAAVLVAVRSPAIRLELIEDWRVVHRKSSALLALVAGFLALLPPIAEQALAVLPQLHAIDGLPWLTVVLESERYRMAVGLLTLLIVVARAVRVPPRADE
ncbi:hypothetical protein [Nevskia sp.]|uniref:hypothetical protein n=1 Tax=Nevskia sp. TaxID=1929292 RepID=UPI0025D18DF9|nr:hypothetical protein [Nevskia sp.]